MEDIGHARYLAGMDLQEIETAAIDTALALGQLRDWTGAVSADEPTDVGEYSRPVVNSGAFLFFR
jgi:hypothetical protein